MSGYPVSDIRGIGMALGRSTVCIVRLDPRSKGRLRADAISAKTASVRCDESHRAET